MMMYIARLYGVLILSAACLVGCGARPALPSLVQLAWQERFGDGYVGYCKAGIHLWLVSSNGLEKFTFERGSRPFSMTRYVTKDWYKVALGPYSTRCQGTAFEAQLSTQTPAALKARFGRPMGDVLWQAGQPLHNSRMTYTINDDETLAFGSDGWRYTKAGVVLDSRRRMGVIVDSVFDGQFVWALSRETLWRVDLTRRQVRQVQIPDHGLKPPLTSLFRDGQLLWMKSRDGRAMPYRIKDLRAVAMHSAGQLATNTQLIELPLQRGELVWRGRGTAIIFRQPSSEKELIDSADAVLHLNPRQLLVAARDTIMLWTVGAAGPVLTQTYRQPGATVDLYLTGDTVIAVGQDYGVLTGRVTDLGN